MNEPMQKLRIAARAEAALFSIHSRRAVRSAVLGAVAMVFALLAVSALNFGAFLALESRWGAIWAGVGVGAGDLAIAGALLYLALFRESDTQAEALALEIRTMSYASLARDVEEARKELRGFIRDVRTLRSTIATVTGTFLWLLGVVFDLFANIDKRGSPKHREPAPEDAPSEP